ncbi:HPP family protein, partial [Streptomyces anulatus]|uniref:HPP family protein n=1 Tax=Streptomyces anulatus TaxID=1892 RepID=UPI00332BC59A
SAALVFAAPTLPLAQPRNVIGGQLVSALVGFAPMQVGASPRFGRRLVPVMAGSSVPCADRVARGHKR